MNLADLQHQMIDAITGQRLSADLKRQLKPNRALTGNDRLGIYQGMYPLRMADALAQDFPAVKAFLDEGAFEQLVTEFLEAHPPCSFTLDHLSIPFAGYLQQIYGKTHFVAEMAAFEWQRCLVFQAPTLPPVQHHFQDASSMKPEQWLEAHFSWSPHNRLFSFSHDILGSYDNFDRAQSGLPRPQPTYALLGRSHHQLHHQPLTAIEYKVLKQLADHGSLLQSLESLSDAELVAFQPSIGPCFKRWASLQVFHSIEF